MRRPDNRHPELLSTMAANLPLDPRLWGLPRIPLRPQHAAGEDPAPLRVAILHDDLAAGEQATQALAAIARDFAGEITIHPAFWPFAMLDQPWGRLAAGSDAGAADLLILSSRAEGPVPATVQAWIRHWITHKQGAGAAVLVMLGRPGRFEAVHSERLDFLRELARSAGVEVFAPRPDAASAVHPLSGHLHEREVTMTPTLQDALHRWPRFAMN